MTDTVDSDLPPDHTTDYFTALDAIGERDRRLATVETITALTPIPDADAIVTARIRGWDVVVRLGEFTVGDRCVYFEVDSMLDVDQERYAFLAPRGVRTDAQGRTGHVLKTARLRGQYSQGLAIDIAQFPELANEPVGFDATEVLDIVKWDPPIPADLLGSVRGMRPTWISKTGAERIQNSEGSLGTPGAWLATEKIDGESMTVWWTKAGPTVGWSDHGVCTRGVDLDITKYDPELRGSAMIVKATELGLYEQLEALGTLLDAERIAVSGELYGEGVKRNPLRVKGKHLAIFRATVDGRDIPLVTPSGIPIYSDERGRCSLTELAPGLAKLLVPVHDLTFPSTVDEGLAQVEGIESLVAPGRRAEGIVWRNDATGEVLKAINNKYLLKNDR